MCYIAANPFPYRAQCVATLATVDDPVSPLNPFYLQQVIAAADLLVPCWGPRGKIPKVLWSQLDALRVTMMGSGMPVKIFGLTQSGDPAHPLMLACSTPLVEWIQ